MQTLQLKATGETETDKEVAGSFVALVAPFGEVDRQGDRVRPGAFRASLARWRSSGKQIPVLADHVGKVRAVVGHLDPRLSFETDQGLEVSGVLDQATEIGRRVYALVKQQALSWSIGYTVPKGGRRQGRDGVTELVTIDLAEISAVAVPAAEGTRTLSIKSADETGLDTARLLQISKKVAAETLQELDLPPSPTYDEGIVATVKAESLTHRGETIYRLPDDQGATSTAAKH